MGEISVTVQVLSLGAGVQSTTLLLMALEGELARPDAVLFADTGWEPRVVYEHLERLRKHVGSRLPFHVVRAKETLPEHLDQGRSMMPVHLDTGKRSKGQALRVCTERYKIRPIERFVRRELLKVKKGAVLPSKAVCFWQGITTDEMRRVRISRKRWCSFRYPLIELGMSRSSCHGWLEEHGWSSVPKSACVGCPYRSGASWRWLREQHPQDWEEACRRDEQLRADDYGYKGIPYLHPSLRALRTTRDEEGQTMLFDGECDTGHCFV